jgi:uncharacterized protein YhaN
MCVFALVALVRAGGHTDEAERLDSELSRLRGELEVEQNRLRQLTAFPLRELAPAEVAPALHGLAMTEVAEALQEYEKLRSELDGGTGELKALSSALAEDEQRIVQRMRTQIGELKAERDKTTEAVKKETARRDRTETEIREFQKQEGRKAALDEQVRDLSREAEAVRQEIELRQLTHQLFDETIESMRRRAGPSLGKSMRRLMPALTGGRYQDLKVDPSFKLHVFTHEKSDFLAQHELSGGTYEGLSLGFRIAFSQAFLHAIAGGPQFLFLDEPFKAMDVERIAYSLRALTRLSPELCQVFVLVPGIQEPHRGYFDRIIQTRVGDPELLVDIGSDGTGRLGSAAPPPESRLTWREEFRVAPRHLDLETGLPALDLERPELSKDPLPPAV